MSSHNWLLASLAGFTICWVLALRALSQLGALEMMLGVTFLTIVAWGLSRAARI
jgi:hypothetical protein